jgi:hypothetical protein
VRKARRRAELARLESEIEEARPFLDLAREIQYEVARVAADGDARGESLAELIERIPRRERLEVAQAIFERLPAERQWAIIERVYGDEEIKAYLQVERMARVDRARTHGQRHEVAQRARAENRLDTREIAPNELVTLGLFREVDVRAAVARGHTSDTCARRLVLRSTGERGVLQVIEDVFNPRGGYFVNAQYDEQTWRAVDRLPGHAIVRVGSIRECEKSRTFSPVLYPGGRADFETAGRLLEGRLHLGFAMLGDCDVFVRS